MKINKMGVWGELYAGRYLKENGYKLLVSNFRRRVGEIDLAGEKDGVLAVVEVKTRGENPMFEPYEAVDGIKQGKIKATADLLNRFYGNEKTMRFDIIEVILNKDYELVSLNHIKDAF